MFVSVHTPHSILLRQSNFLSGCFPLKIFFECFDADKVFFADSRACNLAASDQCAYSRFPVDTVVLKLLAEIAMFSSQLLESSRALKLTRLLSSMPIQRPLLMKRVRDCFMLELPVQSIILILSLLAARLNLRI